MLGDLSTAMLASKPANFCCDTEIVAVISEASNQYLGSTDHAHSADKASRIETIFPCFATRNSLNAIKFDARTRYYYCRVKRK